MPSTNHNSYNFNLRPKTESATFYRNLLAWKLQIFSKLVERRAFEYKNMKDIKLKIIHVVEIFFQQTPMYFFIFISYLR